MGRERREGKGSREEEEWKTAPLLFGGSGYDPDCMTDLAEVALANMWTRGAACRHSTAPINHHTIYDRPDVAVALAGLPLGVRGDAVYRIELEGDERYPGEREVAE